MGLISFLFQIKNLKKKEKKIFFLNTLTSLIIGMALKKTVKQHLENGLDVVFDIDWRVLKSYLIFRVLMVSIFILPPSKKVLLERLKNRAEDTRYSSIEDE